MLRLFFYTDHVATVAYLAAFAITSGMRLATLDKDFRNFEAKGLDVLILSP